MLRIIALLVLFAPLQARASDNMAGSTAANLLAYTFPLSTVTEGAFDIQAAPAYFTTKFHDNDNLSGRDGSAKGFGGAAGLSYGLTNHFAVGVTGIGFKSNSGTFTDNSLHATGSASESGSIGSAEVIFDPLSGDNFRLPILVGLNYQSLSTKEDAINTQKTLNSGGFQAGISAQFNTGKYLRWEPFLLVAHPFQKLHCSGINGSVGQCGTNPDIESDTGANPGLNVVFRPWNLAFFFAPSVGPRSGTSVYALRWSKRIGGPSEAGAGTSQ